MKISKPIGYVEILNKQELSSNKMIYCSCDINTLLIHLKSNLIPTETPKGLFLVL
jgi:hypothetical protein